MILTDEEVNLRLDSPGNLANVVKNNVEVNILHGSKFGKHNVPPLVKQLIAGVSSLSNESQTVVGETFGIDQTTVSAAARDNPDITNPIRQSKKDKAHEAALDSLMASLDTVKARINAPGEIISLKDASRLAKDMASVIGTLEPKQDNNINVSNTKVILFAPPSKSEDDYATIEV